ncbi:type IV secretion system protein VirB4, partial [Planococcus sp. SIMBA_143]
VKGHKIRILDITGEFEGLTNALGGKIIALDGSNGIINPLQVYKTASNEDGTANERLSFTQHLSKMSVFYRFLNPDTSNAEIKEYENLLRDLYVKHGLWEDGREENNITDRKVEEYPIFSDFLLYLRSQLYEDVEKQKVFDNIGAVRRERLEHIELNISN